MKQTAIASVCLFGLLAAMALAQQDKPNFSGNWKLAADKSEIHAGGDAVVNIVIEHKAPSIHVVKTLKSAAGKLSTTEFTCTTDGKDCDAKGVKVSLWFDGKALVEMDASDDRVLKTTFTLDGNRIIRASIAYLSPRDDGDELVFDKT